ncbi:MAG TPA: EamA family transporter [Steroidobacteraceae bacterium]
MSNLQLFAACVAIWGSTWLAITFQLGDVAPEASVAYRFLLASLLLFAFCLARRLPLRFTARDHAWIALQGILMFGAAYIYVYYAEQHIVSGLVAVGYSASPLLGMLGLRLFFGTPMTARVATGSVLGITGIALVFAPEFAQFGSTDRPVLGVVYTALSVVLSMLGSMVAHRNHDAGIPVWQTMAWGMLYGAILAAIWTVAAGQPFAFTATLSYVLSLLYLAVFGSILAFGGYLTLLGRIGAARASYIGVMIPIVALAISAAFEGFHWQTLTWTGIAVSLVGNVLVLKKA